MNTTKIKRIIAWIAIILIASMYLATLVLALLGYGIYHPMLAICLIGTLVVPTLSFIIIWLLGRYNDKHVLGDPSKNMIKKLIDT